MVACGVPGPTKPRPLRARANCKLDPCESPEGRTRFGCCPRPTCGLLSSAKNRAAFTRSTVQAPILAEWSCANGSSPHPSSSSRLPSSQIQPTAVQFTWPGNGRRSRRRLQLDGHDDPESRILLDALTLTRGCWIQHSSNRGVPSGLMGSMGNPCEACLPVGRRRSTGGGACRIAHRDLLVLKREASL